MQGPFPFGSHTGVVALEPGAWEERRLIRGKRYRVVCGFAEADGTQHRAGEKWRFIASMFSPHDDELMLVVRDDGDSEWRIFLRWKPEAQQDVIENFSQYAVLIDSKG
jgi:hypothetical protein